MAEVLEERVGPIDVAVVSISKRARATAKQFLKKIEVNETVVSHELYHAWVETILNIVNGLEDRHDSAILFGHNPGFTYVYNHFDDEGIYNLPTCGIFEIKSDADSWSEVNASNSTTGLLLYPKLFN